MINELRKIALGTVAIAAVIALFATGPVVGEVWFQAANALAPGTGGICPVGYHKIIIEQQGSQTGPYVYDCVPCTQGDTGAIAKECFGGG